MTIGCDGQDAVMAFLSNPATYGPDIERVERIGTHGAVVFLAGDRAYKMRRAVRFPYMDYGTLERRRIACETELERNRPTAPDLYMGVVPVTRGEDGSLRLGGGGTPVEWLTVMRRFGQDGLLDRIAASGRLTPEIVLTLADRVAAMHLAAERAPPHAPWGGAAERRRVVEESLVEIEARPDWYPRATVRRLRAGFAGRLARVADLLDRRKRDGFVRLCHGDLHLRNVALIDGMPTLFDAIDFNPALAWIDVLDDVAFLLMDLDHRALRPLGNLFFNRYLTATGDLDGLAALPLLLGDRAVIRAKVAASAAAHRDDIDDLRAEGRSYLAAAQAYLEPPPPRLVAVGGVSGTGKTSLARRLAPLLGPSPGAVHIRSDVLRKRQFGVPETARLPPESYTKEAHRRVFREMFDWASRILAGGHAVILDGVFGAEWQRAEAEALAWQLGVPFQGLWLTVPAQIAVGRVAARTGDASDATPEIVRKQLGGSQGTIDWPMLEASGDAETVAAHARALLRLRSDARLSAAAPLW